VIDAVGHLAMAKDPTNQILASIFQDIAERSTASIGDVQAHPA